VATKRVQFTGFIEVPEGVELDLGWTVDIVAGKGEVTGDGKKLVHKASGENTITKTFTVTLDADETKLGQFAPPSGPLDEELAALGAGA
jgi:hypothetical protein